MSENLNRYTNLLRIGLIEGRMCAVRAYNLYTFMNECQSKHSARYTVIKVCRIPSSSWYSEFLVKSGMLALMDIVTCQITASSFIGLVYI